MHHSNFENLHYFRSTLFNLPEDLDFKTLNPDGIEIDTRYNEGTDEKPNIYYNLNLKIKFHIYKKTKKNVKDDNYEKYNYNLTLLNQVKNPDIDKNYDRLLSQYVKFNYLLNFKNLELSKEIQIINDLPEPVWPVIIFKPDEKSICISSMSAKFFTLSLSNICFTF